MLNHLICYIPQNYTVNSLLTDTPNSGLTYYSGHSSMHRSIDIYPYVAILLPTNRLSSFRTTDTLRLARVSAGTSIATRSLSSAVLSCQLVKHKTARESKCSQWTSTMVQAYYRSLLGGHKPQSTGMQKTCLKLLNSSRS